MIRRPPRSTLFPLHDALPIYPGRAASAHSAAPGTPEDPADPQPAHPRADLVLRLGRGGNLERKDRSEEHTSELQSRQYLVCRLLLEKKKNVHRSLHIHILLLT